MLISIFSSLKHDAKHELITWRRLLVSCRSCWHGWVGCMVSQPSVICVLVLVWHKDGLSCLAWLLDSGLERDLWHEEQSQQGHHTSTLSSCYEFLLIPDFSLSVSVESGTSMDASSPGFLLWFLGTGGFLEVKIICSGAMFSDLHSFVCECVSHWTLDGNMKSWYVRQYSWMLKQVLHNSWLVDYSNSIVNIELRGQSSLNCPPPVLKKPERGTIK